MQTYLVGGAVRDRLLGLEVHERDWVVVGADPETLIRAGYRPVGRDFPVFLHPQTGEEYALARTERKSAPGHGGFVFHTDPGVRLEDDLVRRDLTINAIAEGDDGGLIDPHGGVRDLHARVLRHVSDAFVEDPLRVLRVARFAARFAPLGFVIADETLALMTTIAASGELETLSAERVWQELAKALGTQRPELFFTALHRVGALEWLFPLLARALTEAGAAGATGSTTELMRLPALASLTLPAGDQALLERFAALFAGAASAVAAGAAGERRNPGLDEAAGSLASEAADRLRAPRECRDAAVALARGRRALFLVPGTSATALLDAALAADAARRPDRYAVLVRAVDRLQQAEGADAAHRGRTRRVLMAVPEALAVDAGAWAAQGVPGHEIGERVRQARMQRLARLLSEV